MTDVRDAAPQGGWTRRRMFEQLMAVGGVSLAMAGLDALGFGFSSAKAAPPALSGKGAKVVILGAGLAGLSAAYELGKAGYEVTVLEARSFAGGRSQTARKGFKTTDLAGNTQECEFDEGLYINHGPWRIPYHHHSTLHYIKQFGVPVEILVNDNDHSYLYFEKGTGPLAGKPVRKMEIAADARGYAAELLAKVAGKGDLDAQVSAEDREKFIAYLVNEGRLSGSDKRYLGDEGRGWATDPGAGLEPGKPSTPYQLTDILNSGAWQVLTSVSSFDQQRTMFQPVGGMDRIAAGFMANLPQGVVKFDTVVDRIQQNRSGVTVSTTDASGAKAQVKADYCLCTIPLSVLKSIPMDVSKPFLEAMSGVSYAAVNKIGLQMKRRFWEEDHGIYGGHVYNDMPGVNTISLPSTGFMSQKGVILGYYAFAGEAAEVSALPPAERVRFAVEAGQKIFPQYAENFENAFSFSWHLEKRNLGGWAEWSEDGRASAYPKLLEPDGRIYLAGEHLSYMTGWQAGAIESAWQQIAKLHARVNAA